MGYTHEYKGFHGTPSKCEICFGMVQNRPWLVFRSLGGTGTSITNVIEDLATFAMNTHWPGVDPKSIVVVEHYPANLNPLVEWQEVTFQAAFLRDDRKFIERVLDSALPFIRNRKVCTTVVSGPQWNPMSSARALLAAQVP